MRRDRRFFMLAPGGSGRNHGSDMTAFVGFGKETLRFLRELDRNNEQAWFEAHRDDYEAHYLAPAISLVGTLGERLGKIAPTTRSRCSGVSARS